MGFKDFISKIALGESSDENKVTDEEIQDVIKEVNDKDDEINSLKAQLEEKSKEYDNLKNRIVDHLFNNPKGKPEDEDPEGEDEKDKEKKPKTFKELINPEYEIKN